MILPGGTNGTLVDGGDIMVHSKRANTCFLVTMYAYSVRELPLSPVDMAMAGGMRQARYYAQILSCRETI
jgi:hypothetical protein